MKHRRFFATVVVSACAAIALGVASFALASNQFGGSTENQPDLADIVVGAQAAATGDQQSALADGRVSWEEHEAAIDRVAQCLSDAGVLVEVRRTDGIRPSSVGFAVQTLEQGEVARAKLANCEAQYSGLIEDVWLAQNRPTAAQEAAIVKWFAACMKDAGFEADASNPSFADLVDLRKQGAVAQNAFGQCLDREQAAFPPQH